MSDNLHDFLKESRNTHAREAILMHRLFLDLKTAAGRSGYYLNTYFDDVDHDGFDVIFDDQDTMKKTQVKTVVKKSKTGQWPIHKYILRPTYYQIEKLGFESSPEGEGSEGGFILMEYYEDNNGSIVADYYYTDVYILLAFECGLLHRTHSSSTTAIKNCIENWHCGSGKEKLTVPRSALLKAKNADTLLALMGLHGANNNGWKYTAIQVINNIRGDKSMNLSDPLPRLKQFVWDEISVLVNEPKLTGG